jgi:hypothetical protein
MGRTGFDRVWGGMFRYQIWVPSHGLCWDEEIQAVPGLVTNVKSAYLKAPWLINPIVRFNEPLMYKVPPAFQPAELLRRFARLPITREAIGTFANEFGFLGKPLSVCYPNGTNRSENTLKLGESFYFWKEEIEWMRFLLDIWDAIQTAEMGGGLGLLTQYIKWNHPGEPQCVYLQYSAPEKEIISYGAIVAAEWVLSDRKMLQQWRHWDTTS